MILMPEELTAENGAKYALIGKFHETFELECPECEGCGMGAACPHAQGESRCEHCDGAGTIFECVPVEWTTIKEIYKHAAALLGKSQDAAIAEAVAEQRRKDMEGQEVVYQMKGSGTLWVTSRNKNDWEEECSQLEKFNIPGFEKRILYTRPANVAALEARVKELEENLKRAERWAEVAHQSCMGTGPKQALGETLNGLHQFLRVALTREGGV